MRKKEEDDKKKVSRRELLKYGTRVAASGAVYGAVGRAVGTGYREVTGGFKNSPPEIKDAYEKGIEDRETINKWVEKGYNKLFGDSKEKSPDEGKDYQREIQRKKEAEKRFKEKQSRRSFFGSIKEFLASMFSCLLFP